MALGKGRPSKRFSSSASSGSYVSTVTMLVFISLCALGLWMLTSSSVVPPHATRTTNAFVSSSSSSTGNPQVSKPLRPRDPPAFDDTPGDLPDDAIKGDSEDSSSSNKSDKQLIMDTRRDPEITATTEQEGKREEIRKNDEAVENVDDDEKTASSSSSVQSVEERKEHSEEEKQVSEESNETVETQQVSSVETGEITEQQIKKEENVPEQRKKDADVEGQEDSQVDPQNTAEVESKGTQLDLEQRTEELEIGENSQQTQKDTEAETTTSSENLTQTSQVTRMESKESSQQTDSEMGSSENQDQTQQRSSEENKEQQKPQKSQSEIQEVTGDETHHQQQQREFQEAEINEDQQYQQKPVENTPVESKELKQSETIEKNSSNQQETQQVTTEESESSSSSAEGGASGGGDSFPGVQTGIRKESNESKLSWSTQADQSENEKERRKGSSEALNWELCNVTAGADYIPCLDNEEAIRRLRSRRHFEHRERHCPEKGPTCLVPVPEGYKRSIEWPKSRDKIWYHNVPHTKLAEVKGHQNWLKVTGEILTFPGGGTQFIHGALHYIDFIQKSMPRIAWGKRTRVILDVGCGVASFGGYLFEKDVLTMSFAPKDEHEAQVQFALERGIPAISAVMGSQRLPFPARVFDLVHCARCRVPWHAEGGTLLLELNRVLRPGGFFVWSATPVYQKLPEDAEIWKAMSSLTQSMCWDLVTIKKDKLNGIGAAIYRKPVSNERYEQRKQKSPPMCKGDDDPNAAWYVPLQACMHRVPVHSVERGSRWPEDWPLRVHKPPYWLNNSQRGIYGKPAPDDFATDYEHWKQVVTKMYMSGLGISWTNVRNVMDMRAVYGGFAAALKDLNVWVMNVVNVNSPDTLPIIYERGLFGIYHDWCESFSTYPRTYDLLHADHLFSRLKKRCSLLSVMAEVDRIVRPGGKIIVRDESSMTSEVESILKSLHWEIRLTFAKDQEGLLSAQKGDWRPQTYSSSS